MYNTLILSGMYFFPDIKLDVIQEEEEELSNDEGAIDECGR